MKFSVELITSTYTSLENRNDRLVITLVLHGLSKTTLSLGNPTERACRASGIDAHSPPKPESRAILSTPRNEFPEIKVS